LPYCAETDIEREIAIQFTTTTELTSTEVSEIISRVEATEIDARIGAKYNLPITGTNALLVLKSIATKLCAGEIQRIYGFNYQREADSDIKERVPALLAEGRRAITDIVSGVKTLVFVSDSPAATLIRTNAKVSSLYLKKGIYASDATDFGSRKDEDKY
jgi:hypothetical protein